MGNLTESTLEVVLMLRPPTWLQVIHERLKHLVISSETFLKGKKRGITKEKIKMPKKIKFRTNKGQERLKVGNTSNQWPKECMNENSSLGTVNILIP